MLPLLEIEVLEKDKQKTNKSHAVGTSVAVGLSVLAVAAIAAAALSGPLASSGPIPNREQNQLLITSTASYQPGGSSGRFNVMRLMPAPRFSADEISSAPLR